VDGYVQVQDNVASDPPASNHAQILADQGGMNLGIDPDGGSFDHYFNGVSKFQILTDKIRFNESGRIFEIEPLAAGVNLTTENEGDEFNFFTGASRTNATAIIDDQVGLTLLTETNDTIRAQIQLLQNHNTPAVDRAIAAVFFQAENSTSLDTDYAVIEATTPNITSGAMNGRLRFGIQQNASGLAVCFDMRGDAGGIQLGFYGATPVAKPTITGSRAGNAALADLLTSLASQGIIVDSSSA